MTCNVHYYSPKGFSGVSYVCSKYSAFHRHANTIALLLFLVPFGAIVVHNSGSEVPTHSVSGPICPKLTAFHASQFSTCCFSHHLLIILTMKCHEISNVIKCQMSWNFKCHEMSNVMKYKMSWNFKCHEMSKVMKC